MRVFFFLLLVAGFAMAGFPWLSANLLERPVGVWPVYDSVTGYLPAHMRLSESQAPLSVGLDLTTTGTGEPASNGALVTLTATVNGKTVLAKAMDFAAAEPRDTNPQTQEKVFHDVAGVIDPLETGDYVYSLGPGDAEGVQIRHVDLVLRTNAPAFDARIQPVGFAVLAIGFIGFVIALGRPGRAREQNPNSQPPPPRWGRGNGDRQAK